MRPLRLTMQAFGAYAREETIDFTELGQERIFVISGKTGAGKSTIFDAMTFALFGKANTNDREGFSVRSHFAKAEDLTEVRLEFLLRGTRYLIRRVPQQDVPKQRGEGMTTVTAKAELYELDGETEKLLASSVRDVGTKITEIMQLTVDQFRQILMIPQGEFRELLVAESKEKEAILQRLARTHFYQAIEERLWQQQKEQEEQVRQLRAKTEHVTRLVFDEETLSGKTAQDIAQLFVTRIEMEEEAGAVLQEQVAVAKEKAEIAAKNVTLAEEKMAEWAQLAELRLEKEKLERETAQILQEKEHIVWAKKAGAIIDQDALCLRLKQQLDEAELESQQAIVHLRECEEALDVATREMTQQKELEASYQAWLKEQEQLQIMEEKVNRALEVQQTITRENERKQAVAQDLERFVVNEKRVAERAEQLAKTRQHVHEIQLKQATLKQKQAELQQQETLFAAEIKKKQQKQTLETTLKQLETSITIAQQEAEEAEQLFSKLEQNWQQEQAAQLALTLVDGEACPVCGALEHPKTATHTLSVSKEALDVAKEQFSLKKEALASLVMKQSQQKWQIEQLIFEVDVDGLEKLHQDCAAELQQLAEKQAELDAFLQKTADIEEQIAANKTEADAISVQQKELQSAYEEVQKTVATAETTHALLLEDVPEPFRNAMQFFERQQVLTSQIQAFETKQQTVEMAYNHAKEQHVKATSSKDMTEKVVQKATEALATQRQVFKNIMMENGFADYATYRQAILSAEVLSEKEAYVQAFEQKYHFVTERLKESEIRLESAEKPDLPQLQQESAAAGQAYHEQTEQAISQKETIRKLQTLAEQFQTTLAETKQAEEAYADVGYLADMARGKNDRRLTFERYVLATFLDTILLRANGRLKKMTNGRFQLIRKKEKSKGNVQSGLELEVYDEYTGLERHVKTLSGGESFKTSLALALALAEVVQEMSGGISLETMFIDEGFGTLDPESLDMAVECLLETQQSGRLVGIISHVPELKERISSRLEVTATNHGSTTKFHIQEQLTEIEART
ncbi:AAA family ATPase [Listeria riparia]|uniref:Nuclease SbcCD subunit C n=1 Tax=Listeria riparia FSL S10-1204 TaxID=1265816 RepID=W7DAR9_9LIST|nr:SMC family ATPase [Listeria riparia]EUJ46302.1 exonuclease, SbcC family protein [Listeria riparia FSL S10-1204]